MKKKGQGGTTDVVVETGSKKPAPSNGNAKSGIARYFVTSLVPAAVILLVGVGLLGWLQFARQQAVNDALLADVVAAHQATLINEQLAYARKLADRIAASDLVDVTSEQVAADTAARLSEALPGASVHVVASGQLLLPATLSFSARDVVQKARTSDQPVVTVLPGSTPVIHVGVATASRGVVLLTWKMERIKALLGGESRTDAHITAKLGNALLFEAGTPSAGEAHTVSADAEIMITATVPPRANDPALLVLF